MDTDRFDFLRNQYSAYEIKSSQDGNALKIVNPFGGESIIVEYVPDDEYTPYIVYFAFQHCHMNDEENILEYINDIIAGKIFSIEFFNQGNLCFGGDITIEDLQHLSYDFLVNHWGFPELLDRADAFKVRGWRCSDNLDAIFVADENGQKAIQILPYE